jgi:hypothetical protein
MRFREITPLAAAAILLFAGAWRVASSTEHLSGYGLFALGAVCLGAWIALYSRGDDK